MKEQSAQVQENERMGIPRRLHEDDVVGLHEPSPYEAGSVSDRRKFF